MRGKPLCEMLGIELLDFDITKPSTPEDQAELRRLFCEHHLLLIRGQTLTNADHDRFVEYFGPRSLPPTGADSGYVTNVANKEAEVGAQTGTDELLWHADGAYGAHPGIGTSLWAKEVVPGSTPTMFLNAVRALETLPRHLRAHDRRVDQTGMVRRHNESAVPRDVFNSVPGRAKMNVAKRTHPEVEEAVDKFHPNLRKTRVHGRASRVAIGAARRATTSSCVKWVLSTAVAPGGQVSGDVLREESSRSRS